MTPEIEKLLYLLAGALVGGLIGHTLALGRDKRREFNTAAEPVLHQLETQLSLLADGRTPKSAVPLAQLQPASARLSHLRRRQLAKDHDCYKRTFEETIEYGDTGDPSCTDPTRLASTIRRLLKHIKLR